MVDVKIRLMKKADLQPLAKMYVKIYNDLNIGESWTVRNAKKLLEYYLKKQPDLSFVAEVNGKPIGAFSSGVKPWFNGNKLFDVEIFVAPEYQGQGIGKKLTKVIFETALKKYDVVEFEASTYTKTGFTLKWYKSLGVIPLEGIVMISGKVKSALKKLVK